VPVPAAPAVARPRANVHMIGFRDHQRLAVNHSIGHTSTRPLQQPLDRATGNVHRLGGLLLVEPLEVTKGQSLQFVQPDLDDLKL